MQELFRCNEKSKRNKNTKLVASFSEKMEPVISGDGLTGEFPELLQFCARAEALIAELLLLADRVPSQFLDPRFDPVLFDLRFVHSHSKLWLQ